MILALWFAATAVASGGNDAQWRLVYRDGNVAEVSGMPQLPPADIVRLRSAWEWSATQAPRRVEPTKIRSAGKDAATPARRLDLHVIRKGRPPAPADLRVIAAPIEMWSEVPEGELPSFPVPPAGHVLVPVDGQHRWRVRVAAAFVFLQQGATVSMMSTGADGSITTSMDGGDASAVRAAAYAGGLWALGSWTPWDVAQQQGLPLVIDPAGHGALLVTAAQGGRVRLLSMDGWDLSWMYQLLGLPLQALPGNPLEVSGLPVGSYGLSEGAGAPSIVNVSAQGAGP